MKSGQYFGMREEYSSSPLLAKEMAHEPVEQFDKWFQEALRQESLEVNAMTLSTFDPKRGPSSRVVLLKEYSPEGFIFFTNYNSRKGREFLANPQVSLLFFWPLSMREVRIEGEATATSHRYSEKYFNTRPKISRASAILSKQSEILLERERFIEEVDLLSQKEEALKRPTHWGGVIVKPKTFEFWQGGKGRVHDRFLYTKERESWQMVSLYP